MKFQVLTAIQPSDHYIDYYGFLTLQQATEALAAIRDRIHGLSTEIHEQCWLSMGESVDIGMIEGSSDEEIETALVEMQGMYSFGRDITVAKFVSQDPVIVGKRADRAPLNSLDLRYIWNKL